MPGSLRFFECSDGRVWHKAASPIPQPVRTRFDSAIFGLGGDEERRRRLAMGALERIKDFSWEKKAASVDAIYRTHARK